MAKKFTDLTNDTTPASADIIATAKSPFGGGTSRKVTLANLWFAIQTWLFATDSVGTDSYAITLSPAITAYTNGQLYRFKAGTANTGAATLNINGLGAKAIKKMAGGLSDLATNDIRVGQMVDVVYDLTNDCFQMQSAVGNSPSATPGGSNTQVQFNDSSAFGGVAQLTWDKTTQKFTVGGSGGANGSIDVADNVGRLVTISGGPFPSITTAQSELHLGAGSVYLNDRWRIDNPGGGLIPYASNGGFNIGDGGHHIGSLYMCAQIISDNITSATSNEPFLSHARTWNNAGVTFENIVSDITDSGSNAASTLINLKVGGSSKFKVDKSGNLTAAGTVSGSNTRECLVVAASDETTALATGTAKVTFRMPFGMTLTAVRASLTTAQASGSIFTVDINKNGTTVLSTKITIDNTEKTSTTAATPPVISVSSLDDDDEITVDIDQIGTSGAAGLKIYLIGAQV